MALPPGGMTENKSVDSLKQATEKDAPAALVSALRTGISRRSLKRDVTFHWMERSEPACKCLVVCTSIEGQETIRGL